MEILFCGVLRKHPDRGFPRVSKWEIVVEGWEVLVLRRAPEIPVQVTYLTLTLKLGTQCSLSILPLSLSFSWLAPSRTLRSGGAAQHSAGNHCTESVALPLLGRGQRALAIVGVHLFENWFLTLLLASHLGKVEGGRGTPV